MRSEGMECGGGREGESGSKMNPEFLAGTTGRMGCEYSDREPWKRKSLWAWAWNHVA